MENELPECFWLILAAPVLLGVLFLRFKLDNKNFSEKTIKNLKRIEEQMKGYKPNDENTKPENQ